MVFDILSVNQPEDSYLAKAAKASEVYKLIIAINTAAPNESKRYSKRRPQTELSLDINSNRSLPHRISAF